MSYTAHSQEALGVTVDEILAKGSQLLSKAGPAIQAAGKVVEDPFLPELTCQVLRLNRITQGKDPGPPCARTVVPRSAARKGIGLSAASRPIRMFVWAREHPLAATAIGVGVVGAIFSAGYWVGKQRRA